MSVAPATTNAYATAYQLYLDAGWPAVLPLPPGRKAPVPTGYTGHAGAWPTPNQHDTWADETPGANLALRLPKQLIGIDVDAYGTKPGRDTLHRLEQALGALPDTWRVTSRDDGTSGIRFYQVPGGLAWPGIAGPGIETIHHGHRYAVAWPSTHPAGGVYRWYAPGGVVAIDGIVPSPDNLPRLPTAWVDHLTGGRAAPEHSAGPGVDATAWLRRHGVGQPCAETARALTQATGALTAPGATRHDAALAAVARLARLATEGHTGVQTGLDTLGALFVQLVTADGTRDRGEATAEWRRIITGALPELPARVYADPCIHPFDGILTNDDAAASTPPAPTPPTGATWAPIDLAPFLDGTWRAPEAALMVRTDGAGLLYPGLVHDFHGESESGKSFLAQALTARLITTGHAVAYIDYESSGGLLTHRLINLGATAEQVIDRLAYIRPDRRPDNPGEINAWRDLLAGQWDLVVIDGVTDALIQHGAATKDNDLITAWHRTVPRAIATHTGAAVLLIDHVTKDTEGRGRFAIGGQAKMAAIDGASFLVEVVEPIAPGLAGTLSLRVGKDRNGTIRACSGPYRAGDRTQQAALIHIDSTDPDGHVQVVIDPPDKTIQQQREERENPATKYTGLMERLSRLLEAQGEQLSKKALFDSYRADGGTTRYQTVLEAIEQLITQGSFEVEAGPRNAQLLSVVAPYRQSSDPESDRYEGPFEGILTTCSPPVPTCSRPVPGTGQGAPVPPTPLRGGGREQVDGQPEPLPVPGTSRDRFYQVATGEWLDRRTGVIHHNPEEGN